MKKISIYVIVMFMVLMIGCGTNIKDAQEEKNSSSEIFDNATIEVESNSDEMEIVSIENTWAYDVTDTKIVKEHSDYFVKVRVKSKEKARYYIENAITPHSTYNLEVLDVIYQNNDNDLPKNIKIVVTGGVVTKEEYLKTLDRETKEKIDIKTITDEEKRKQLLFKDDSYYQLNQGEEYYIFIKDITDDEVYKGYYCLREGGYDVFLYDNKFYNVLTDKELEL